MLGALIRHGPAAILVAVAIEELGLPMPIPTDLMIVFLGANASPAVTRLATLFVVLTLASALGGTGLYIMVRRGGRPLVDRFGRYVHLGPEQLSRAEALLARLGWTGIAIGRAVPGVRYATVIACGLLKVPYLRYVTAHLAGSAVYIAAFLALGATFGASVLEAIHLPAHGFRLLWLLALAVGLPLLVVSWERRVRGREPPRPSRGRLTGAVLLGAVVGAAALSATVAATATVAELLGAGHPLNVAYSLLGWTLLGLNLDAGLSSLVIYAVFLALLIGLAAAYHELLLPRIAPRGLTPIREALGLALITGAFFAVIFLLSLLVEDAGSLAVWWRSGGPTMVVGTALAVVVYAATAVHARALAVLALGPRAAA